MKIQYVAGLSEFYRMEKEVEAAYRTYAAAQGISESALQILYSLYLADGETTQTEICADWSVPLQTINSSLKKLERAGLLRLVCKEENRREKRILLTRAGEALAEALIAPLVRAENESFLRLTRQEQDALIALTRKQCDILKEQIAQIDSLPKEQP